MPSVEYRWRTLLTWVRLKTAHLSYNSSSCHSVILYSSCTPLALLAYQSAWYILLG